MRFTLRLALVASLLIVIIASGVTTAGAVESPNTITKKAAAAQYLADIKPWNAAGAKFNKALNAWAKQTDAKASQTPTFVDPMVKAGEAFQAKVLRQKWPVAAKADVRTLVNSLATLDGDLSSLPSVDVLTISSWVTTFDRDTSTLGNDADVVRSDLGLPANT